MAANATEQQQPKRKDSWDEQQGLGISDKVRNANVSTLQRVLRVLTVLVALLLALSGILAFIELSLDVPLVLLALYVIIFSLILLGFELNITRLERSMFRYFGFMFTWFGRTMFLLFVATLAFGLGTVGQIAGGVTIALLIFTAYVMKTHPTLASKVKDDLRERREIARGDRDKDKARDPEAARSSAQGGVAMTPVPAGGAAPPASGGNPFDAPADPTAPTGPDWERLFDDNSKRYYYHNTQTGETRW
jgi:hypothetical protein